METITEILAGIGLFVALATPVAAALERMSDGLMEYSLSTESKLDDQLAAKFKDMAHSLSWALLWVSDNVPVISRRKSRQ